MKSIFVRILLVSFAIASFVTGCKKDCIRNTDCYSGESCTLGVCTIVVRGPDGATVGTMTPVAPTATATATSTAPVTPIVDAAIDAAHDAH